MTKPTFEAKRLLRIRCRRLRDELGEEYRQQASAAVCALIEGWQAFGRSEVILTYMPMKGEVDLRSLLERHPQKSWVLPRIRSNGRMVFHPYDPERLTQHPYGMLEPAANLPLIPPEAIHLALIPGLAYDRRGVRLGYGGGFFDRFLAAFAGQSLGVTYQALLFDRLLVQKHDQPVKAIVTEAELFLC